MFASRLPAAGLGGWLAVACALPAWADQTNARLDGLFQQLKMATALGSAQAIEGEIWQIWTSYGDPDIDRRMSVGILSMQRGAVQKALDLFDEVVDLAPGYAEGWNKRATVYYMMGRFSSSVIDIQRTLDLEPRHFGALSGLGQIYDALGNSAAAVKVWEKALTIHPHMPGIQQRMEELKLELTGKPL
ncbi:MAG: tetratricopeptide repeat protein [Rhodospirillaceae bacterium]